MLFVYLFSNNTLVVIIIAHIFIYTYVYLYILYIYICITTIILVIKEKPLIDHRGRTAAEAEARNCGGSSRSCAWTNDSRKKT